MHAYNCTVIVVVMCLVTIFSLHVATEKEELESIIWMVLGDGVKVIIQVLPLKSYFWLPSTLLCHCQASC